MSKNDTGKKNKKVLVSLISVFVLVVLAAGVLWLYDSNWQEKDEIANVSFNGVPLKGLSHLEAEAVINEVYTKYADREITLVCDGEEFSYSGGDLGLIDNNGDIVAAALTVGREGNIFNRYKQRLTAKGADIDCPFAVEEKVLTGVLSKIAAAKGQEAKDAYFYLTDDYSNVAIKPSVDGISLDFEKNSPVVAAALNDLSIHKVELFLSVTTKPDVTTADLEALNVNGVLATFSTKYNPGLKARTANLNKACSYLDMAVVGPGETFSFNSIVGERTASRGFKDAVIIENGVFTDGMGGGVCQVSTTLYGALIRTGLNITQRNPHSLAIAYADPGQDAMVAWGSSDLTFTNNYDSGVVIHIACYRGTITAMVFGNTKYKQNTKIRSEVVRYIGYSTETVKDASMAKGVTTVRSQGKRGLECYVYKTLYDDNGNYLSKETVNHSTYRAQKKVVVVGTKKKDTSKISANKKPSNPKKDDDEAHGFGDKVADDTDDSGQ